jgi:hypothetical protein
MEFDFMKHFRNVKLEESPGFEFRTHYEQGSAFFTFGSLGERIKGIIDEYAKKRRLDRRSFLKTASGFAAAMLAVNKVSGMKFFEVSEAEAIDEAAAAEYSTGSEFIIDMHTHVGWRKAGFTKENTTERGMWFVKLLDDLGNLWGYPTD